VIHPLDVALRETLPIATMPRFGEFQPLSASGQRLLLGENGLFLEVRRPWLHAIAECGVVDAGLRLPFGRVKPQLELPFGLLPRVLVDQFIRVARERLPNEVAGAIVLDTERAEFELRIHEADEASAARIDYRALPLRSHEALVVDLHSHGIAPAGFSAQDDLDDCGATKVAVVVGRLDRKAGGRCADIAVRLVLNGLLLPLLYDEWKEEGDVAWAT
jgi:PRTRC genetic system protein A